MPFFTNPGPEGKSPNPIGRPTENGRFGAEQAACRVKRRLGYSFFELELLAQAFPDDSIRQRVFDAAARASGFVFHHFPGDCALAIQVNDLGHYGIECDAASATCPLQRLERTTLD